MKNAFLLALFPISGLTSAVTQASVTQASVTQASAIQASEPHALQQRACIPFTSALTLQPSCCDELTHSLFWTTKLLGLGICCVLGEILDGFHCTAPPPAPSAGVCSGEAVCPSKSGADLGIKYGHCYVLEALSGLYLGHDYDTKYEVQGENPGVVFRVCGDTTSCNTTIDAVVGANDTWWMQDQMGSPSSTGFGWLGGGGDLSVQDSPSTALVVGGSSVCYGGKCAVCITFPPGGAHAPCPLSPGQSHLGISSNPNNCQSFFWQEVGCRSEK
ncbi:hypothetical protein HD806DRAFT_477912 [Xylariaceae sp. AK1471]|nr:hypothetical protein HD806DRAFT_477912 [Xylariaceae sp. AK1471]